MGLLGSIRKRMPGAPTSIAKNCLKVYELLKSTIPSVSEEKLLEMVITNRYEAIPIIPKDKAIEIAQGCKTLGDLVYQISLIENYETFMENPLKMDTLHGLLVDDLYNFFKNKPRHIGGLAEIKNSVDQSRSMAKAVKKAMKGMPI